MSSWFAYNPRKLHWNTLKYMLAYIKDTIYYKVIYKTGDSLDPIGYVDFNFASYRKSRYSTEGNIFIIAEGPVSWKSKCQETILLSTVEAKYIAFTRAMSQAIYGLANSLMK